jgi:hypothetical protein
LERLGAALLERKNFADALPLFRETIDIARELINKDPDNMVWRADLTESLGYVGDVLRLEGDVAGATVAYREGLDIRRTLAAKDTSNSKWKTNVVLLLVRLAWAGDDPRARFTEALMILQPLKEQGRLEPSQRGWIAEIERQLAALPEERVRLSGAH